MIPPGIFWKTFAPVNGGARVVMACSTPGGFVHKTEIEDTLSEVVCKFWGARGGGGGGDAVTTVSVAQPEQIDVQPPGLQP